MSKAAAKDARVDAIAAVFAALGSSTRLAILVRLADRPHSVTELAKAIGAMPSNVSLQLGLLKDASLVTSIRTGRTVTYTTDGPEVNQIIEFTLNLLRDIFARRNRCLA